MSSRLLQCCKSNIPLRTAVKAARGGAEGTRGPLARSSKKRENFLVISDQRYSQFCVPEDKYPAVDPQAGMEVAVIWLCGVQNYPVRRKW